jgi:ABC-type dipeptide/oligopeptide/nickel transport system permease component
MALGTTTATEAVDLPPEEDGRPPLGAVRPQRPRRRGLSLGSGWIGIIVRRLLLLPVTLFVVGTATFFLIHVVGGSPAARILGPEATPDQVAALEKQMGLARPLMVQYWEFLTRLVHGDLGESYRSQLPVMHELIQQTPATIELVVLGVIFGGTYALIAGIWASAPGRKWTARATQGAATLSLSAPIFWVGGLLSFFFFFKLHWAVPPIGQASASAAPIRSVTGAVALDALFQGNFPALLDAVKHLILPVLTLAFAYQAVFYGAVRNAATEAFASEALLFNEACGLPRRAIWLHVARASLRGTATYIGIIVSGGIGSAVLVERVYSWGGVSQYGVEALTNHDFPAVQGFVLMIGVITVLSYLAVDILYALLDPRVHVK